MTLLRVSVVVPTYNSGPLVVEAVESALAQTYAPHEVIVVDDGSTDDTADRLARFGPPVRYVRQENARVAAARNTGLRVATGDVIAFLDADDVWHPEKLARQTAVLEAHPAIGLLGTRMYPWPGPLPTPEAHPAPVSPLRTDTMLPTNPLANSSVVVRRSTLERVGELDPELFGPEDYDLWLRCSLVGGVGRLELPLTGYRDTPASLGKQAGTMYRGLVRIHKKLADAGVWAGRPWFRRKCKSHNEFTTAHAYYASRQPEQAVRMLVRSLWSYPVPMGRDAPCRCARLRLLAHASLATVGALVRRRRQAEGSPPRSGVPLAGSRQAVAATGGSEGG
jgi:glycosyltransferase involved in cell wall biosynthesis